MVVLLIERDRVLPQTEDSAMGGIYIGKLSHGNHGGYQFRRVIE